MPKPPPKKFDWQRAVLAAPSSQLDAPGRLVLMVLCAHMNSRTSKSWPGIKLLVAETALSERAVRERLRVAVRQGWLTMSRTFHAATVYTACLPSQVAPPARSLAESTGTSCLQPQSNLAPERTEAERKFVVAQVFTPKEQVVPEEQEEKSPTSQHVREQGSALPDSIAALPRTHPVRQAAEDALGVRFTA